LKPPSLGILAAGLLMALLGLGLTAEVGAAESWSFAVLGDQRDAASYGINQPIVDAMAQQVASQNPAFVLAGGDQIRGIVDSICKPLPEQYTHWKTAMAPILSITYPIRGNHETYGEVNTLGPDYAKNWMDNIANVLTQIPKNGPANEVGMTYSFSRNNVFIVGLDQDNVTAPQQVNQAWLNQQLAGNNLPFTFVYGHYPAFAVDPTENSLADHKAARDAFWKSLGDSSINIYFAGHNHMYNRAEVSVDGGPEIQQIVVGTGGAPLGPWNGQYADPRVRWENDKELSYGYSLVTVDGNKITVDFYVYNQNNNTWSIFDTYVYLLTSRNFGANDANQTIDPATLNTYYSGIKLHKIGQGILTLSAGASTYADAIRVSAGELKVQGDYRLAPVNVQGGAAATLGETGQVGNTTVDPGGILSGTGTVVGTLTNRGTVSPGHSPGTLKVAGSYTQTSSGILRAEIASPRDYDKIDITAAPGPPVIPGTASLNGTLTPVLLNGYRPPAYTRFPDIIKTSDGLTGAFSAVTQPVGPTLLWQPYYDAASFGLTVQRDYANPWLGLNANQQQVGLMLNSVAGATTGDLGAVLATLDSLPANADVQYAYKQLSPEKAGALANLGFGAAAFQRRNLATRTTNLRFVQGESGGSSGTTSGGLGCNYSKLDGLMLAYNGAALSNLFSARKEVAAPESRWGLFMDGGAAFGNQKTSGNQTGYNFTLGGFTAGADYRVRDNLLVGLATGYSNTSSDFYGSGGKVNANTIPFNAYAAYFPGSLYAYGSLGYALNLYDLKRGIDFGGLARSASSSTTGNQFNLYGETGYDLKLSGLILTPSANLAYSHLWVGSLNEQGADSLNLKVGAQDAASLQTGLGGRVTAPFKVGSVKVAPQGYAFYQHEFANGSRGLNASLSQGSSTFNFQTDAAKRNFAVVGANITLGIKKNLYAQVNYNAEVGRGNYTAQNITAGLRLEF
jgi:outer membrane autotransporter protein